MFMYFRDGTLAERENAVWIQVERIPQKRQPKELDRTVVLLTDQQDLAVRQTYLHPYGIIYLS
jgi:hypothetical protein